MLRWPTAILLLALAEGWGPPGSPPHSGLLQNSDIYIYNHTHTDLLTKRNLMIDYTHIFKTRTTIQY